MSDPQQGCTRPFAAVFGELNRGRTAVEAAGALQELVEAVTETGRKGSLTITLTVAPTGAGNAVQIGDEVKLKKPAFDRAASLFYVTEDHNLSRTDPNQLELPLASVPGVPASIARSAENRREGTGGE